MVLVYSFQCINVLKVHVIYFSGEFDVWLERGEYLLKQRFSNLWLKKPEQMWKEGF